MKRRRRIVLILILVAFTAGGYAFSSAEKRF